MKKKDQSDIEGRFYYGYLVVTVSFLIITIMTGIMYSYGVFFDPMKSDFGWTNAQTSGAYSLYMVFHGLLYIVTGRLNDRFGPRLIMTVSGILLGIGYLLMSQISIIWQLYLIYGIIIAFGMSGGYVPLVSTVSRWFVKRRSLMTGICVAGIGAGTMVMPPFATWLISNYNWRTSFIVIGIISLLFIVPGSQFLKSNPTEIRIATKEDIDGIKKSNINSQGKGLTLCQAIHTIQFWLLFLIFFCFGFYIQTIMVHIVIYAKNYEPLLTNPAFIMTIIGALSIIGRILIGASGDKIGNKMAAFICFALMFIAAFLLMLSKGIWMFYIFGAIFGFSYGGLVSVQSPLIADLFGLVSHGTIFGIITFAITIGGGIGPLFAGYMLDLTNSYHIPIISLTIISGINFCLIFLLKSTNNQNCYKQLK
jgi:MFS family permease